MKNDQPYTGFEIAIVGMACRFPGARDWRTYWENLKNGIESVQFLSNEELTSLGVDVKTINDKNFVNVRIILEDKDRFDADFFKYRQRVAALMNPQHRIFHECVWEALEDAGYVPQQVRGISLYAGAGDDLNWKVYSLLKNRNHEIDDYTLRYISDNNFLPSLISYSLDLQGPSFSVHSACSTSLVAIHLACKSLLLGEVKMALAGGVSINTVVQKGYFYQEGMIDSADGHCRAFDKDASGTLKGEGAGVVVLKRLTDAMQDGDHIYAIIKGSAINNDGNRKVGFTAPSVEAQAECIKKAQRFAKVEPATIGYVEAHGSGTRLGDPIEMAALNTVFKNKAQHCAIGSVKSNMGHLNTAAGIAGLIKAVLSLKHKAIPASLHYKEPNPEIDFAAGPFYVNTSLKNWEGNGNFPLRAAVNSFGIGGTNAHVILEEAPAQQEEQYTAHTYKLLTLSAKTESALLRYIDSFKRFLLTAPVIDAADMAYTSQIGRKHFACRKTVTFRNREELLPLLNAEGIVGSKDRSNCVVCIFSAEGAQYVNMGRGLYESNAFFSKEMEYGFSVLEELTGKKYKDSIYPKLTEDVSDKDLLPLQHLVFPFQYALARLIMSWGVNPRFMIGDDIGQCVIACIKGELSYKDALKLAVNYRPQNVSEKEQISDKIKDLQTQNDDLICICIGDSGQQTEKNDLVFINLIKPREHTSDDVKYLLQAIGQLWAVGVFIDWRSWYKDEKRKRISLPTYSFEPTRYPTEVNPFENGLGYEIDSINSISAHEANHAETGTDSQTKLKEIFESLLEIEDIGAEDDFLKLGGNSLVAMLIVKRIEKVFNINLALDVFFSNPTIKQLAFAIDETKLLLFPNKDTSKKMIKV
jgi:phthiocerol/phenolphthiocerol synthesis type-I polyketide synthase E